MRKAIPAIAIAVALIAFWAFRREELTHGSLSAPSPDGPAAAGSGSRERSSGGTGGSRSAGKGAPSFSSSSDDGTHGDRTPPLEHPAVAKDGFVEARATAHGKPVAFAEVRLYARLPVTPGIGEQPWRVAGVAKTGSDGVVRIPARPGAYLVAARADGFAPARKAVVRASGDPVTRVELDLSSGVSLAGRTVSKGTHEPVSLAQVIVADVLGGSARREPARRGPFRPGRGPAASVDEVAPVEERSTATSDQEGRFRVEGLAPGRYRVEAQATGTARTILAPVIVPADQDVVLELAAASFIEGSVVDSEGKLAPGAEVIATGGPNVVYGETTGTGTFSLEVEPRTHFLSARSKDQAGKARDPVSVAAGQTARGVKIQLGPGASLAGAVVARASSLPIAGARINLSPAGAAGSLGGSTTDAAGNFVVGGLSPGQYDVDISADGFTAEQRRGLVLLEGQRFPLQISLKANGTLQGVVHDLAGKTVVGAVVRAGPQFGDPFGEARTDSTGAYQLAGLPAGRLMVAALRDGAALGSRQVADVPEGGVSRLDLTLAEEGLLTGKVTSKSGAPVLDGSAVVQISPAGGGFAMANFASVTVDPDGSYRASVPAGSYRITAGPPGGRVTSRGPRNAVFATVQAGQTISRDVVADDAADAEAGLTGTVLEPGGVPSPGAFVMVLNANQRVIYAAPADDSGAFRIDRARSDLPDAFDVSAMNGGRMGKTSVATGQTQTAIQLQPAASLRGHVASAAKVDGFTMTITIKQGGRMSWFGGGGAPGGMQRQLQFSGDQFVADDLPATDVSVHVVTTDGRIGDGAASLVSGQAYQLDIALQDAGNVLGRVVDEAGAPIAGAFVTLDRTPAIGGDERISGPDGRFRLVNVAPGNHSYVAFSPNFRSNTGNFSLQPGQALDLGDVRIQGSSTPPGNIGIGVGGTDAAVQVSFVFPDGPAARAGMQIGDQLVQIDGRPVAAQADARARLPGEPGTMVSVTFVRNGGSPQVVAIQRQPST